MPRDLFQEAGITPSHRDAQGVSTLTKDQTDLLGALTLQTLPNTSN